MKKSYVLNVTSEIKKDLVSGRPVVGTMFIEKEGIDALRDPFAKAKELGYRFVIIDCEHQLYNPETLSDYAKRAHEVGISIWIRPAQMNEAPVSRYLDAGFNGVLVANIIDVSRLRRIISQAYYDPIADKKAHIRRGYSIGPLLLDGQNFSTFAEEINYVNQNTIVVCQVEHPKAIVSLCQFFATEGVQGAVIGMNDLSLNLSLFGGNSGLIKMPKDEMYKSKPLKEAFADIAKVARELGKPAGVHIVRVNQLELTKMFIDEMGYRLMVLGTEANFFSPKMLEAKAYIENKKPRL